jgi:hypothetical protein
MFVPVFKSIDVMKTHQFSILTLVYFPWHGYIYEAHSVREAFAVSVSFLVIAILCFIARQLLKFVTQEEGPVCSALGLPQSFWKVKPQQQGSCFSLVQVPRGQRIPFQHFI